MPSINSIITQIQPTSSGSYYNLRSSALRFFIADDEYENTQSLSPGCVGGKPESGYYTFYIDWAANNWDSFGTAGTMFFMEVPSNYNSGNEYGKLYMAFTEGSGVTEQYRILIDNGLDFKSLEPHDVVLCFLDANTDGVEGPYYHIMDHVKITDSENSIGNGTSAVPTGNAVYNFVTNMISNRWQYIVCANNAASIPEGAQLINGNYNITGTLEASASTEYKIYLVKHTHTNPSIGTNGRDGYDEWITIHKGNTYLWEKIGNTDIDLNSVAQSVASDLKDHTIKIISPTDDIKVHISTHNHSYSSNVSLNVSGESKLKINISTIETTGYTPYIPKGSATSTFSGSDKYITFIGSETGIDFEYNNNAQTYNSSGAICNVEYVIDDSHRAMENYTAHRHDIYVSVSTFSEEPKISVSQEDAHHHTGQIGQITVSTNVQTTISSMSVSNEVLVIENVSSPRSVSITIATQTFTTSSAGAHTHTLNRLALGSIFKAADFTIGTTWSKILVGTHNHVMGTNLISTATLTPKGLIVSTASNGAGALNIKPSGTVNTSVTIEKVFFGGTGDIITATASGTVSGTTGNYYIGTINASYISTNRTLTHAVPDI